MKAYLFPGQGAQFEGMGADLYENHSLAKELFDLADELLGYRITEVMFGGSADELKQTKITQPAIFLHSVIKARLAGSAFEPDAVAGHSLGEFSALVACGALGFEDGLGLVQQRALAMQKACEAVDGTMAAVLGLEDGQVEQICASVSEVVVPANYNCPGQLVISGTVPGVEKAKEKLLEMGARKAIILQVGGAFHSPLMEPAKNELQAAIEATNISRPSCPVYQNITARPHQNPDEIRKNLVDQLTGPVKWTQTMQNMIADGLNSFFEVGGNGKVLRGFLRRINRQLAAEAL